MIIATFAGFSLGFNPRRRHHPRGTKRGRPRGSRRGGGNGTTSTRPVTGMESVEGMFLCLLLTTSTKSLH